MGALDVARLAGDIQISGESEEYHRCEYAEDHGYVYEMLYLADGAVEVAGDEIGIRTPPIRVWDGTSDGCIRICYLVGSGAIESSWTVTYHYFEAGAVRIGVRRRAGQRSLGGDERRR